MKHRCIRIIGFVAAGFLACFNSQAQSSKNERLLTLEKEISMPGIKGRIDHMDIDVKNQIAYVAALGNNTLEVVDLKNSKVKSSIKGLDEPQGIAYIIKHNEILVANGGTGECYFYNAETFGKTGSIKLDDDADDVRYDESSDRIYVGYGTGGIAVIDANSHKLIGDIKLPAHPESFQLDTKAGKLWVNLPGSGMVGVVDLHSMKLTERWSKLFPRSNFPMAYDNEQQRIIVGYRMPARLVIYDGKSGKEIFSASMVGDVDDLYWDKKTKQIFISGGGGAVNVFKQTGETIYKQVANILTQNGARTSLFVPQLSQLIIAARAEGSSEAALLIYKTN